MNKWAFALAAGVVLIVGCSGGGGGGGGNGGNNGGNPGDSTAFVTIPNLPGSLHNVYLTGQGREEGDLIAVMHRVAIEDSAGRVETELQEDVRLQLNGFTHQIIRLDVPSTNTRVFDQYTVEVQRLDLDNGEGANPRYTQFTGNNQPLVTETFPAYFRIFPGRETAITVRLDDSMFVFDFNTFTYNFDRSLFELANFSQFGTAPERMNGFLSDYLVFDLRNLQDTAPDFPDASGTADALFINGDNFALGTMPDGPPEQSTSDPKPFFVLTPVGFVEGSHVGPRTAIDPNSGNSVSIPGTYTLVQGDPRPPEDPAARITALMGTYKYHTKNLISLGNNPQGFEIIAFPGTYSDDLGSDGGGLMDIVLFNTVGGQITHMYFGQMDFNNNTITAYPIAQVTTPENTSNEITGTISGLVTAGGSPTSEISEIRSGRYTLDSTNLPATFSTSGRFIVYRR